MSYKEFCWLFDLKLQVPDTVKPHAMSKALSPSRPSKYLKLQTLIAPEEQI